MTSEQEIGKSDLAAKFDEVATMLSDLDINRLWEAATDQERRVLVQELIKEVRVFPDHLEVLVDGAPRLNVSLEEVGLKAGQLHSRGVGGGT